MTDDLDLSEKGLEGMLSEMKAPAKGKEATIEYRGVVTHARDKEGRYGDYKGVTVKLENGLQNIWFAWSLEKFNDFPLEPGDAVVVTGVPRSTSTDKKMVFLGGAEVEGAPECPHMRIEKKGDTHACTDCGKRFAINR